MPRGLEGLVRKSPFTLRFRVWALWKASSKEGLVMPKLLELEVWIGMISTPVLHFKSLSNLDSQEREREREYVSEMTK